MQPTQHNGDEKLFVRFYRKPIEIPSKSADAGRPIFEERDFVKIMVPGDKDTVIDREVWDDPYNAMSDTGRWPKLYEAFKSGRDQLEISGTPLSILATLRPPILSEAHVEEFKPFGVHTAEQLVAIPDAVGAKFMGIQDLKRKVQQFLDAAKSEAPVAHLRAKLDEKENEVEALRAALKEQGDRLEKLEKRAK
jgi:hypothetical protein